jgi:hypothetical protein
LLLLIFVFPASLFLSVPQARGQGFSLSLDGQSWVKVANSPTLDAQGSITVETWVKTTATARAGVVEHYNNSATTGSDGGYALRMLKNGQVAFFTLQNAVTFDEVISTGTVNDGKWHHLAGVYDAGTGTLSIYIDGFSEGSASGRTPPAGTGTLLIGTSADSTGSLTGSMDEVRVTRAAVYTSNFTPSAHASVIPGTVGLWNFDNQTVNDSSGLGNNGAIKGTGSVTFSTDVPVGIDAPPTVVITSPVSGTIITGLQATVTVSANASDSDGAISQVQFLVNGSIVSTLTSAPYTTSIVLNSGTYTLNAIATDNAGLTTTSSPVTVTIQDLGPAVSITAPANNATFASPANITVSAVASESGATVSQVQFFANTTLIGTATSAPYSISWNNVQPGSYSLTAKATDNFNVTTVSNPVNITVTQGLLPTVSLTAPSSGSSFSAPANITLIANAAENGGTISQVQFFANGNLIGTATAVPYSFTWSNVGAGNYSLTATAIDGAGHSATSSPVSITVGGIGTPNFQGFLDAATCTTIAGWAWDSTRPNSPINVDIFDGSSLLQTTTANLFRQDLLNAGIGNGFHAFNIATPSSIQQDSNTHVISARFSGTSMSLSASPKSVNCAPPTFPVSGRIFPKYLVLDVIYAPPGSKSNVNYGHSTMLGTSTSVSSSFTNTTAETVSVSVGTPITGTVTNSVSQSFSQEQDTSSSIAVNETTTQTTIVNGPASSGVGLSHDSDAIRVWFNPALNFTMTDANTIVWTGYSFDERDADVSSTIDYLDIPVAFLDGHAAIPPGSQLAQRLARSWADDPLDGSGRGLTSADLAAILKSDPFTDPTYTVNILVGSDCTADGRFCKITGANPSFQYLPAAPGGQPETNTYAVAHQTTETQGQGGSDTTQITFSTESKTGSAFSKVFSLDLKTSDSLTWTNKWSTQSTRQVGQTASLSITGPASTDNYTGPTDFTVFQDNVYGSFMFAPVPAATFSLSASTPVKVPVGGCGVSTVTVSALVGGFNSILIPQVSGLPAGATGVFNPSKIPGASSSQLTLCASSSTPLGPFQLTISATTGAETHSVPVTLKVK